ncbi:putative ribonuclease H-like domain-containing protein [Tanacetum coccineum]
MTMARQVSDGWVPKSRTGFSTTCEGVIDSGCSRHMTRNMSYLTDFEEIDGGYVAFGGNPKGGKITGRGTIKTGNLDFENVYFVRELKFNLFSVSQMCDKKNSVLFNDTECIVLSPNFKLTDESQVLLKVPRKNNMYSVDLKNIVPKGGLTCLFAKATSDESKLWHRRLGHINFKTMNKLVKENLVRGLPSKLFKNNQTCVACQKGKQHRASCKSKTISSISQPLHMLHMDLFGPTFVKSLMKKMYCLVVTDDYSRFSWVFFLATKDETSGILKSFITGVENLIDQRVKVIRCDNGTEFKNKEMNQFCERKGIKREFSVARTPQQNGVAERKNRTLIEAARTMLADSKLPTTFWAEAVNTACYVQNRVLVTKPHNKTPYELFLGRKPALGFMRPFRCLVIILSTIDLLSKFDGKVDEGFFVRYSINSKAFRVFNSRTRIVEENLHVQFSENTPNIAGRNQSNGNAGTKACEDAGKARMETVPGKDYILLPLWTDDPPFSQSSKSSQDDGSKPSSDDEKKVDEDPRKDSESIDQNKDDNVNSTNNVNAGRTNEVNVVSGKISIELLDDPNMPALEDIVYSNENEDVGAEADMNNLDAFMPVSPILTTRVHKDHPVEQIIGDLNSAPQTRRMIKNLEEHEKGIDYDEVFAPFARIEAIMLFLAYASFKDFVVYQTDVKSAFLYGKIEEEVYVCQPLGFEDPNFPDRVYKVEKELYVLDKSDILLVQVCVDDIIFCSTKKSLCTEFEKMMHKKFQMSSMGELTFFLGLQVKQKDDGIFISKDKYVTEILKKFSFTDVKTTSTPMETQKLLLKDEDGKELDVHLYRSMIGSLMYLTSSRPNIMFVVCACARYQVNPNVLHLHAVKMIFRFAINDRILTIYTSCTEQFWATAKVKTVNGEVQLQALVDGKKIIVTKASVRRYLQLNDEEDNDVYEEMDDSLAWAASTSSSLEAECQDTMEDTIDRTMFENVSKSSNDSLLVGEITSLKLRVKKLEKKGGSRTHKLKRLYKVGRSARVISSDEASLGDQEDASKQGRKIDDMDKDAEITLVHETQGRYGNEEIFDTSVLDGDEVLAEPEVTIKDVNLSVYEVTLAQALAALKTEEEEERLAREKGQREEEATIVSWDNVQAMIHDDYQMAQQMQAEEQEELSIKEKSKLFVELLEARKKNFAAMRAQEMRNKPPTKA